VSYQNKLSNSFCPEILVFNAEEQRKRKRKQKISFIIFHEEIFMLTIISMAMVGNSVVTPDQCEAVGISSSETYARNN
jgi:hypothetical protein